MIEIQKREVILKQLTDTQYLGYHGDNIYDVYFEKESDTSFLHKMVVQRHGEDDFFVGFHLQESPTMPPYTQVLLNFAVYLAEYR